MQRSITGYLVAAFIIALSPQPVSAALPSGFSDALVANVERPTALAFTPDVRILIANQPGQLHVYQDGVLVALPALDLGLTSRLCSNSERGLLGVAVDPDFAANRFVYLYYTFNKSGICPQGQPTSPDNPVNRVARFTLSDANSIDLASEIVLIDNIPSPNGNHGAGDLHFGKDGYLYVSVGDGGCDYAGDSGCAHLNDASRDRHVLLGKILRVTRDGDIPPTNPYLGETSARCNLTGSTEPGKDCQETFATGLRNPFRFAFDPNASSTRFFINDVGQGHWEEIDLGAAGADYGWNTREGPCPTGTTGANCTPAPANFTDPVHAYSRSTGCMSITGGAFVPNGQWPAGYDGSYMFSDYVCGKIFRLAPQADGTYQSLEFATELGSSSAVHLAFGPHDGGQALYYTTYKNGGQVRRISSSGAANRAPKAVATASPRFGPLPLNVNFDASGSSDPDGDALTYEWSFGDGSPPATGNTVAYTYAVEGQFQATLTISDGRGGQAQASVRIDPGHAPPRVTVLSPSSDTRFRVGQPLTLNASAVDEGGNQLPDSALNWTALLHHNTHTHPYIGSTPGNNIVISAPAPEDLPAARTSYLELKLVATDARGMQTTVRHKVMPKLVKLTFASAPSGLRLDINGTSVIAPRTFTSWEAYQISVIAPNQKDASGRQRFFKSWPDGGARSHVITTPSANRTYRATFR